MHVRADKFTASG